MVLHIPNFTFWGDGGRKRRGTTGKGTGMKGEGERVLEEKKGEKGGNNRKRRIEEGKGGRRRKKGKMGREWRR